MVKVNDFLVKIKKFIEKYAYVCLFIIFVVFLFSRLFRLANLPYGIHVDEQGAVLDGYYLSHYGYDRNMAHMPPHLRNYFNGQSALYAYSAALVFKILPFSIFAARLPAVIWGCVGFFYLFVLCKDLFNDDKSIALLGPVFYTIFPYIMSSQRWGLDCNLYAPLAVASLYYFIKAMKSTKIRDYAVAGAVIGLTLYTYALSYVVTPIFLIFAFIYMLWVKRFEFKKWVAMAVPCFVLALPLILYQLVNMEFLPEFNFLGMDILRLGDYRAGEISFKNVIVNLGFIPKIFFGGDGLPYNAFDNTIAYGTVYAVLAPVIIAGIIMSTIDVVKKVKIRELDEYAFIWLFTISSLIVILLGEGPSINHVNQLYPVFCIYTAYCIVKITKKWYIFTPAILLVSAICFLCYSKFYFMDQNDVYGKNIIYFYGTQAYEIVNYAEKTYNSNGDKTVYFEEQYEDQGAEVFLLSALKDVPPWEFDESRTEFKNVKLHFPENFDENENAIYIVGYSWDFIASYLIEIGFNVDLSYENYFILYR
ncbi:MAG: glycosyltransferase family 39 protein [Lachnospiraceae bacterium]|nr:glycosyltransferase family 39 protein [Lachnospiraceae bacterium]